MELLNARASLWRSTARMVACLKHLNIQFIHLPLPACPPACNTYVNLHILTLRPKSSYQALICCYHYHISLCHSFASQPRLHVPIVAIAGPSKGARAEGVPHGFHVGFRGVGGHKALDEAVGHEGRCVGMFKEVIQQGLHLLSGGWRKRAKMEPLKLKASEA